MPFAVSLDLDLLSAAALAPLIDAVERADPKAMTPPRAGVAPHVSLAVYDRLDAAAMIPALQRFAGLQPACDVKLSSLDLFPEPPSVLFAAPVVSAGLLELHGRFHHAVASFVRQCWAHYLPGDWVPHITLGEGMRPATVPAAVDHAIAAWRPRSALLHRLSLVRFQPVERLWSTALVPAFP